MQLFGVTNPNHLQDKEYQSNKVTPTGGGRISSLRDEETLNVRWAELMKQGAQKELPLGPAKGFQKKSAFNQEGLVERTEAVESRQS